MDSIESVLRFEPLPTTMYSREVEVGIYKGAIGRAIIFLLISKKSKNYLFTLRALDQLNVVAENLFAEPDFSFTNGLNGIGWGLEFIVQNSLYEDINTDDILEELDDEIYKITIYSETSCIDLNRGVLGFLSYYVKRLSSVNKDSKRFRRICNQECLAFHLEALSRYIYSFELRRIIIQLSIYPNKYPDYRTEAHILASSLYTLSHVRKYEPRAMDLIESICDYIHLLFLNWLQNGRNQFKRLAHDSQYSILFLAINVLNLAQIFSNDLWANISNEIIDQILETRGITQTIDNDFLEEGLKVLCLLNIVRPSIAIQNAIVSFADNIEDKNSHFNLSSGIGLAICARLSVTEKDLIKDWYELFFVLI